MRDLLRDIRYALRTLTRAPGFTIVALLTIALGIGANTAIFSLVNAVILKPLPFRQPSQLVAIWDTYFPFFPKLGVSPIELDALERQSELFEQTAWYRYVPQDLDLITPDAPALELHATFISPNLLSLLGVAPAMGHGFSEGESSQSVLLNHQLWKTRFGGNPNIVGQAIRLGDQQFTVAGVMPTGFRFPDFADIWLPKGPLLGDEMTNARRHPLGFLARLSPGITRQQASERIEAAFSHLAEEHPSTSKGFGVQVFGLQQDLTANHRPALLLLLGAVALVLLIACGNVANLLLSRAASRRKEIAIRTALGAGMGRIVRQLLTESVVLSVLGGGLGLVLAAWSLSTLSPIEAPIDSSVLLFLALISIVSGVIFGLAPVFEARKNDPITAIKTGALTARGAVVVFEFALALMVIVGAGILVKSFMHLMNVDPGFKPDGVLTMRISAPPSTDLNALYKRIEDAIRPLPGVQSVAAANTLPIIATRASTSRFVVPDSPLINPDVLPVGQMRFVSPDYLATLQIPLRSGRWFTERDLKLPVAVVNESMAQRFWPGQDAIGRKFYTGPVIPNPTSFATIIGVVADVKQFGLDSDKTMDFYFPNTAPTYLILRTSGDPSAIGSAVQREIQNIDRGVAISDVRTMDQVLAGSTESRRWTVSLLAAFGGLALLLSLIGIYGVTSWAVSQRTREIGIRMALGADATQVRAMVVRQGIQLCGIGLLVGLGGALVLRRFLASLAFDVSTADPFIYGGATLMMLMAAVLACYVPARRASRVDPLVALRCD